MMRKIWILFAILLALQLVAGSAAAQGLSSTNYRSTMDSLEIERRIAQSHLEEDVKAYAELQKIWQETLYGITSKRAVIDRMVLADPKSINPIEMAQAERELQDLVARFNSMLYESQRIRDRITERVRLITAVESSLGSLGEDQIEGQGPLNGVWEVSLMPVGDTGIFVLSQTGPEVVGEYLLEAGDRGTLEGTFADGKLRIIRRDNRVGNHSVLEAAYSYTTETLNGTWQMFELSSGGIISGDWVGHRKANDADETYESY
jgi:hypothetical protein